MNPFETWQEASKFAKEKDQDDLLKKYRGKFYIPKEKNGKDLIYLCGNSLGLQPKETDNHIMGIMSDWKKLAVEGHFAGDLPWIDYHDQLTPYMARIIGAQPEEVAIMNGLTVNLHLMMVSFYRPTKKKYKVLIDYSPFPSDRYAVHSHIASYGFDPTEAIIELKPSHGEIVSRADIDQTLEKHGHSIALVMIAGINYYTGQLYPLNYIVEKSRLYNCKVGFDLAHAAGNVPLSLHETGPDFAVWCTYKYLNAGPGNLSGCFIHSMHHQNSDLHRFAGWWGYRKSDRFMMTDEFIAEASASGWILSNPPVICFAAIKAALEVFEEAGMENLIKKSHALTSFMENLIFFLGDPRITILTPSDLLQRGCQLSIRVKDADKSLFYNLKDNGVIGDWREPDVIRVAPVPLYNSFEDVLNFAIILKKCLDN